MKETIHDLTSSHWWITVAIASLVLNILAAYFVRGFDRVLPKLSARIGSWCGQKTGEFAKDIDRASNDPQLMTFLAARQAGLHIAAIHNYVLGAFLFYLGGKVTSPHFLSMLLWLTAFIFTLAGSGDFGRAMRCKFILDQTQRKLTKSVNANQKAITAPPTTPTATAVTTSVKS